MSDGTGVGSAPSTGTGTAAEVANSLTDRALQLAQVGRVKDAYPLLVEAMRVNPDDNYILLVLGNCYQREGRWSNMLAVLDIAAQRAPGSAQVHRNRSVALRQLGRIPEAIAAAEQARAIAPDDAANEVVRAEALLRRNGTRPVLDALGSTRRARELDPESVWAHVTEGKVQRRMAEFGRARAAYLEALRLAPDDAAALYGLATLDADRGRAVRADPVLGGMLQVVPNDPAAIRAATLGARQALWLLTDLGCLLLVLANFVVVTLQELIPSRPVAAVGGVTVTVVAVAGVLALLRWRLARLSGPVRALIRANRYRFGFVTAPLRIVAMAVGMLLVSFGPNPPEPVEVIGPVLFVVPLLTLLIRWRSRTLREFFWFVRRCWFRLHRQTTSPR